MKPRFCKCCGEELPCRNRCGAKTADETECFVLLQ